MSNMKKCWKCGLGLVPKSHNFSYKENIETHCYKCDDCIINETKGVILDGLKKIAHKISFEKIREILDENLEKEK